MSAPDWADTLRPVAEVVIALMDVDIEDRERARLVSRCLFGVAVLAAHGSLDDLRAIASGFGPPMTMDDDDESGHEPPWKPGDGPAPF